MVQAEAAAEGFDLPNRHYSHAVRMRDRRKGDKRVDVPTAAMCMASSPSAAGRPRTQSVSEGPTLRRDAVMFNSTLRPSRDIVTS